MSRFIKRTSTKKGMSPGSLIFVGEKKIEKTRIRVIDFTTENVTSKEVDQIEDVFMHKGTGSVSWINIDGLHDTELINKFGKHFGLHSLLLEDILNTEHRPKIEEFGEYIFIVLKMLYYDENEKIIISEQLSLILGNNLVITFQERVGDVFNPIRQRIKNPNSRIRKNSSDYLAYALIDAVVDTYFSILEDFGERIDDIEEDLMERPNNETLREIHSLKRELVYLRKSIWPLRELVSILERTELKLISANTKLFLRDLYDHVIQIIDTIENYREMASGMLDIYLSSASNRMNEVMKILTIMASIFIPLTFIAGVYGMNFENMPELHEKWGYPVALIVMILIAGVMITYFKRKDWL